MPLTGSPSAVLARTKPGTDYTSSIGTTFGLIDPTNPAYPSRVMQAAAKFVLFKPNEWMGSPKGCPHPVFLELKMALSWSGAPSARPNAT